LRLPDVAAEGFALFWAGFARLRQKRVAGLVPLLRHFTPHRIRQASYAPLLAAGMGIMFLRLLVLARLLDIAEFAALSGALIVSSFIVTISCFGLFLHLQRRLPVHLARGQRRAAAVQMAQTVVAALAVAAIGVAIGAGGIGIGGISPQMIAIGAVHGLAQQLFLIATTESRSSNEPLRYAVQHFMRSTASVALALPVAVWLGSASLVLAAEAFVSGMAALLIMANAGRRLRVSLPLAGSLSLRSFGRVEWVSMMALLTYSVISSVSSQIDRWLSSAYLAERDFAHYSFAWTVMIAALSLQALINASVYPMIARRLTLAGPRAAWRLAAFASLAMFALSAVLIAPALWAAGLVVNRFLPDYADALPLFLPMAIAAALRLSDFWSSLLIIGGRERAALSATLACLVVVMAVWFMLVGDAVTGLDLAWLAVATALAVQLTSFVLCFTARLRT
jgi:O-antigen/teichoic acid export membrane protein